MQKGWKRFHHFTYQKIIPLFYQVSFTSISCQYSNANGFFCCTIEKVGDLELGSQIYCLKNFILIRYNQLSLAISWNIALDANLLIETMMASNSNTMLNNNISPIRITHSDRVSFSYPTSDVLGSHTRDDLDSYLCLVRRKIQEKYATIRDLIIGIIKQHTTTLRHVVQFPWDLL